MSKSIWDEVKHFLSIDMAGSRIIWSRHVLPSLFGLMLAMLRRSRSGDKLGSTIRDSSHVSTKFSGIHRYPIKFTLSLIGIYRYSEFKLVHLVQVGQ